jgi:lipopolysaccharide/colanic/teichoic acid biosynthesis glycosyltransferase
LIWRSSETDRHAGAYARAGKRALDIVLSIASVPFVMVILAPTWLAVTLGTGSNGLFRQDRIGLRSKHFHIWKLRTMRAESRPRDRFGVTEANDSRIIPVGRLLRRWKLDELPQIWNVLRGDMSIVGPRPEVPLWVEALPDDFAPVLTVRPGITGLATLVFRDEESVLRRYDDPVEKYGSEILPLKLRLNRLYADNVSFSLDITLIGLTLLAVASPKRAKALAERLAVRLKGGGSSPGTLL